MTPSHFERLTPYLLDPIHRFGFAAGVAPSLFACIATLAVAPAMFCAVVAILVCALALRSLASLARGPMVAVLALCCCLALTGCAHQVSTSTPSAPADPYATALSYDYAFSQALSDAQQAADGLHTTLVVDSAGVTSPILDDVNYAKVKAGIHFFAGEGQKLSDLLAARADAKTISLEMSAMTAALSAQLSPDVVGIKNADSQARYITITNIVSAALRTLANYVALIQPTQESYLDRRRDPRSLEPHHRAPTLAAYSHRSDPTGPSGRQEDGHDAIACSDQRKLPARARRQQVIAHYA